MIRLVFVLNFMTAIAFASEFSQYWRIMKPKLKEGSVSGVSMHGNCLCLSSGQMLCGKKRQTAEEVASVLDPKSYACIKAESIPDSEQGYYQCYDEKKDCSQDLMKFLNQQLGCEASVTNIFPLEDAYDKKLGNLIEFKSAKCRLSAVARKISCPSGFKSQYLNSDKKDYKICIQNPAPQNSPQNPKPGSQNSP